MRESLSSAAQLHGGGDSSLLFAFAWSMLSPRPGPGDRGPVPGVRGRPRLFVLLTHSVTLEESCLGLSLGCKMGLDTSASRGWSADYLGEGIEEF